MVETNKIRKQLVALFNNSFPKKCNTCGRVYDSKESIEAAFKTTVKSELVEYPDPQDQNDEDMLVANYSQCPCGSTLFVLCQNRRDNSWQGKEQRAIFKNLSSDLTNIGLAPDNASFIVRSLFRELLYSSASITDIIARSESLFSDLQRIKQAK